MASSNADFGQRIVCSARSLASTFSGVPENVGDLGFNHFVTKQTLETAQSPGAVIPTDFSRNALLKVSATQSFRSAAVAVDIVENDYQGFVASSAVTLPTTGVEDDERIRPQENEQWERLWTRKFVPSSPELRHTIPIWKRASTGKVVYSSGGTPEWSWEHEWRRINNTHPRREESKQEPRTTRKTTDSTSNSTVENGDLDYDRPSPLARLLQIQQHLVSTGEEDSKWPQDWDISQHGRCDWNVDDQPQCQKEQDTWYFSCDRTACHHTLLRANENLTLEISQRVCVHEDCAYVSDTVESWLRHITSPHHEEEENQSGSGLPNSDKSVTRTAGVWLVRKRHKLRLDLQYGLGDYTRPEFDLSQDYERGSTGSSDKD